MDNRLIALMTLDNNVFVLEDNITRKGNVLESKYGENAKFIEYYSGLTIEDFKKMLEQEQTKEPDKEDKQLAGQKILFLTDNSGKSIIEEEIALMLLSGKRLFKPNEYKFMLFRYEEFIGDNNNILTDFINNSIIFP